MERGNVLVIGNSGAGKSTLIDAVLGEEAANISWGAKGATDKLSIYESEQIPFRIIDTVGFEGSFIKEHKAISAVKKWSKDSAKGGQKDNQINVIWFCVEGTSRKLFPKAIKDLLKATSMWDNVPVIVAITKSYSVPEREQNIEMVNDEFAKKKRHSKNLRRVIPIVASTYVVNVSAYVVPEGITELIDVTNELMPEGVKAGEADIAAFKLKRKRALAHGVVGAATAAAVAVGAVPVSLTDALILSQIEMAEANALAQIYGINEDEGSMQFINTIVEVGTISAAAKAAISGAEAIPEINLDTKALNAIIAGGIVAAMGEGTTYAFEQVYLGKKSAADIEWAKQALESKLSSQFIDSIKTIREKITKNMDRKAIANIITDVFTKD